MKTIKKWQEKRFREINEETETKTGTKMETKKVHDIESLVITFKSVDNPAEE